MALKKGCTAAQLALAWLLAQGDDVVPIPGTRRIKYLTENIAAAKLLLSKDDLQKIDQAMPAGIAADQRYTDEGMKGLNA